MPNGQIARAGNLTQDWARAMIDVALARESDVEQATDTIVEIAEQTVARPDLADRVLEPPTARRARSRCRTTGSWSGSR